MLIDPRFRFLRALNELRDFLVATQNDFSRRRWVGRGFHPVTGHVKIAPDGYSSEMCEELLLLMLSIDAREKERAMMLEAAARLHRAGRTVNWPDLYLRQCAEAGAIDEAYLARMVNPQFELISAEALLMIDFAWARYSVHRPFRALWCYREVYDRGRRFNIPKIDPSAFANEKYPAVRWAPVQRRVNRYNPLFDPIAWSLMDRPGVEMPAYTDQTVSMEVNEDDSFTVDAEGAFFILNYEIDHVLKSYHDDEMLGPMAAVHYYLRIGTISVPKGRIQETGMLAERNMMLKEAGFDPAFGPEELLKNPSISDGEHRALIAQTEATRDTTEAVTAAMSPTSTMGQPDLFSIG